MYSINLTLLTGFTWNSWPIFFPITRILKCLWNPSIVLYTLSWCYDAECDPLPSYSFLFHRSIGRARSPLYSHWTERPIVLKTQNNIWLIYFSPDVNECSADSTPCDDNADCSNTEGSYSCRCKSGFIGNGTTCQGSEHLTTRKAVSLLANVSVILGVEVCLLYFRENLFKEDAGRAFCRNRKLLSAH